MKRKRTNATIPGAGDGNKVPPADKQFKAGSSGNPGGRPKEFRDFKLACQRMCGEHIDALSRALGGGEGWAWQFAAAYAYGKPEQRHPDSGKAVHDLSSMSDAELLRIARGGGPDAAQAEGDPHRLN